MPVPVKVITNLNALTANAISAKDRLPVTAAGYYWEARYTDGQEWENPTFFPITLTNTEGIVTEASPAAIVYSSRPYKFLESPTGAYPDKEWQKLPYHLDDQGNVPKLPDTDAQYFYSNCLTHGVHPSKLIKLVSMFRPPTTYSYVSFLVPKDYMLIGESWEYACAMAILGGMPTLYSGAIHVPPNATWMLSDVKPKVDLAMRTNTTLFLFTEQIPQASIPANTPLFNANIAITGAHRATSEGVVVSSGTVSAMMYQIGVCYVGGQVAKAQQQAISVPPPKAADVLALSDSTIKAYLRTAFPNMVVTDVRTITPQLKSIYATELASANARGVNEDSGWVDQLASIIKNYEINVLSSPTKALNLLKSFEQLINGMRKRQPKKAMVGNTTVKAQFAQVPTDYGSLFTTKKSRAETAKTQAPVSSSAPVTGGTMLSPANNPFVFGTVQTGAMPTNVTAAMGAPPPTATVGSSGHFVERRGAKGELEYFYALV